MSAARDSAVRVAVLTRAGDKCEACGGRLVGRGVLEYWFGDRQRRGEESLSTGWALCQQCSHDRADNRPDAATWNAVRRAHCDRYGLAFVAQKETLLRARPVRVRCGTCLREFSVYLGATAPANKMIYCPRRKCRGVAVAT